MGEPYEGLRLRSASSVQPMPSPYRQRPTLTEFLLARLAEDERAARTEWPDAGPHLSDCTTNAPDHAVLGDKWCDCAYPARVLAEVGAKRRIVEASTHHARYDHGAVGDQCRGTLELLALPYADHLDYDEAWRR